MIKKLDISGIHADLDKDVHDYTVKKIGGMDRFLSRHARESAHAEVKLVEGKIKTRKQYTCEVILRLPKDTLMTKETANTMFAAIDAVESKLKNQLKKYKEMHGNPRLHRRVLSKILRSS
jgi:ribosomal subunit interface protein